MGDNSKKLFLSCTLVIGTHLCVYNRMHAYRRISASNINLRVKLCQIILFWNRLYSSSHSFFLIKSKSNNNIQKQSCFF